ncbi:MAG TPA: HAD family phosphatase [Candidatus Pacearchaeota archaeon]|nr:HAD family phosphatase [Candidatus Parcubacteria bacterium]HOC53420.1 HAD family phosphatase [Candidatus Pacearchaeota archaeon]HQM24332.1 HAD family phosphatase [Candidatus Pacearchaeota archaeon]
MEIKNIKAILFDLDGTLYKTEAYQLKAWNDVLEKRGVFINPKEYYKYVGKTALEVEKDIIKEYKIDIEPGELEKEKETLLIEWFKDDDDLELMPHAKEVIEFFSDHPTIAMGLCTSGSKNEVICKLEKNNLFDKFDIIITKDDVSRGKPFPDVYLEGMKRLGLEGKECLAVEDTEHGLESAKNAGAYCFVVPQEFSKGQNFSKADKILNSLGDLIVFFKPQLSKSGS